MPPIVSRERAAASNHDGKRRPWWSSDAKPYWEIGCPQVSDAQIRCEFKHLSALYQQTAERTHSGVGEKGGTRLFGRAAVRHLPEKHQCAKLQ
ncbi:MAG TPA: hypothetical protein VJS63_01275 [Bradyrhizobium sp.]|nr:hypothetical protein [Bradyrhizobium sp.]